MTSELVSPTGLLVALLADPPDMRLINDPETWAEIKKHAARHGVAQLVAFNARPHVQAAEREWCDRVLIRSWTRHRQRIRDLEYTLAILDGAGIDTVTLKGPILAERYYNPSFLRRPSYDLDLLICDTDLEKACEALSHAGYRNFWPLPESRARSHHVRMIHASRPTVELHFRLSHFPYAIAADEFFGRAGQYETPGGRMVRILDPADEIFQLILHNAHHRFASFFHFNELRRIWVAAAPDVRAETVGRAIRHHFAGALAMTDIACRSCWGRPFLDDAAQLPKTWLHGRINERLYRAFASLTEDYELGSAMRRRWADLQLTDRPVDAARFAGNLLHLGWYRAGRWLRGMSSRSVSEPSRDQ